MVFKRRNKKGFLRSFVEFFWPKGGWTRAFQYVKHRLHRLPGTPETIARGVWAGVFTSFTPFFGLHFLVAAILARVLSGNLLAALLSTFFGNPLTYLPIGIVSLKTGHFLLGTEFDEGASTSLATKFANAGADLWHNLQALFSEQQADWHGLAVFYDEVFLPYSVGAIIPGIVSATVCYYVSVPVIRAYQKRRSVKIKARLAALRDKALNKPAKTSEGDPPSA